MTPGLILPHDGVAPVIASDAEHCGPASAVIGATTIGADAWLGTGSVIRADGQTVTIGDRFRLGPRATVHIATDTFATVVGARVTVGRNAVVHACTVGSDVVIEDDCVILDGSTVGDGVLIEAGSIVFPRSELEPGHVYAGCPAKKQRAIGPDELADRATRLRAASEAPMQVRSEPAAFGGEVFVASTARVSGPVTLGRNTTILFSCDLIAEGAAITVGAGSNVQDNSVVIARREGVVIGRETTIGHNVHMEDCRIGAHSLIGIGCVLASGTVVADDVLLAAGAVTEPGQLLDGGKLWGGRPARVLGPLDDDKREMMRRTVLGYQAHGRAYRELQAAAV